MSILGPEQRTGFPPDLDHLNIPFMRALTDEAFIDDLEATMRELASGEWQLFFNRVATLKEGHVPPDFLIICWQLLQVQQAPFATQRHRFTFSAAGYLEELHQHEQEIVEKIGPIQLSVLKTVSASFPIDENTNKLILISGLGDFRVSKQDKRDIAEALGMENWSAKQAQLNPPNTIFRPWDRVQYISGLIKPMVEMTDHLDAICFIRPAETSVENEYVAFTASSLDSLILPVETFWQAFEMYAEERYKNAKRVQVGNMDIWVMRAV